MGEWINVGRTGQRAYLALPEAASAPGVLVLHAWWGLTPVFTDVCDRLAAAGYVALAPQLYPGGVTATTIPEAEALINRFDEAAVVPPVVQLAAEQVRALSNVTGGPGGGVGFSMAAYWALDLSQRWPSDVPAVVIFYGTNDGNYDTARAAYLGHFAENDPYESLEAVSALEQNIRAAGRYVSFYVYP